MVERIVKLQRIRVRQAEKLDFLEEHTRTLVNELQKKAKIIKNYILHENPDAMGSNERDRNKVNNRSKICFRFLSPSTDNETEIHYLIQLR